MNWTKKKHFSSQRYQNLEISRFLRESVHADYRNFSFLIFHRKCHVQVITINWIKTQCTEQNRTSILGKKLNYRDGGGLWQISENRNCHSTEILNLLVFILAVFVIDDIVHTFKLTLVIWRFETCSLAGQASPGIKIFVQIGKFAVPYFSYKFGTDSYETSHITNFGR